MADKVIYWSKTALTGGAAGALDSIDGADLQDGEVAHVWVSNVLYIYRLDADSAAAESSPAIIAPDTNAGDKRWILQSYYSGSGTLYTDHIAESTAGHGVEIDGVTIKDSGLALGSDADGDMYYRASSALARLPKGAALAIPRMNSGATAPEWGAAGQIVFPATQNASADANTLDDYEEGTWTPVAKFGTDDPTSVTTSGGYIKIGKLVFINGIITLTTIGAAAGDLNITGLPFNPAAITAFSFSFFQVTPTGAIVGRALTSGLINIYSIATSGTRTTLNNTHFGDGSAIYISGCYSA